MTATTKKPKAKAKATSKKAFKAVKPSAPRDPALDYYDEALFMKPFMACCVPDKTTGCWNWTAGLAGGGKVVPMLTGIPGRQKNYSAPRVAYGLFKAPVRKGSIVVRTCDNNLCVNPDHLEVTTIRAVGKKTNDTYRASNRCVHGHDLSDPRAVRINKRGDRICLTCEFLRSVNRWRLPSERRGPSRQ